MILAKEPQKSGIYVSLHAHGLFVPSKTFIRQRKIALGGGVDRLAGPALLARWYERWLRVPLGVVGRLPRGNQTSSTPRRRRT